MVQVILQAHFLFLMEMILQLLVGLRMNWQISLFPILAKMHIIGEAVLSFRVCNPAIKSL